MKNVITINHINCIGGVEEFIYQLAKNYERDFTVYYRTGDPDQINRLMNYCNVIQFTGNEQIVCERAFYDYGINYFIDHIEAKEHYEVLHADYKVLRIQPHTHPKVTKYIAVSETIKKHFLDVAADIDPGMVEVVYNPLELSEEEKTPALLIGSFTRLTGEKGGNRIKLLAEKMNEAGINYLWFVFSNYTDFMNNRNVIFLPNRLDGINSIMACLDYVCQVSDSEGCSYTEQQAKMMGIPMIHTPYPAYYELGETEGDITLEFDCSNVDEVVEKLKNVKKKIRKSSFVQPKNRWDELLLKGGNTKRRNQIVKIKALREYYDTFEKKDVKIGDVYETTEARARLIESKHYAEIVEIIEEPEVEIAPEETKEEKPKRKRARK